MIASGHRRTIRRHVFSLCLVLAALAVASVLGGYVLAQRTLEAELWTRMEQRVLLLRMTAAHGGTPALLASLRDYDRRGLRTFSYNVTDAAGRQLFGPAHFPRLPVGRRELGITDLDDDAVETGRVLTVAMRDGATLSVIADTDYLDTFDRIIIAILACSFALMSVLALIGGLYLDRIVRRRLSGVNETATALAQLPDLEQRVPLSARRDEFDALAATFNQMLDRIGNLLAENMRVTGYIAHDLRTPLVRLADRLADARNAHDDERGRLLGAAEDDVGDILELFDAFLAVGQQQARGQIASQPFDLSGLVEELADSFAVLAEASGRTLQARVEPDVTMDGREALITQLLVNLIENAIRHTDKGTRIAVSLAVVDAHAHLIVADHHDGFGPSVDAEVMTKPSLADNRQRLGFKLAQSIVRNHQGSISRVRMTHGTTVQVILPLTATGGIVDGTTSAA